MLDDIAAFGIEANDAKRGWDILVTYGMQHLRPRRVIGIVFLVLVLMAGVKVVTIVTAVPEPPLPPLASRAGKLRWLHNRLPTCLGARGRFKAKLPCLADRVVT